MISLVIIGATSNDGTPSWKILGQFSDRAIIESAKQFLPLGYLLMIVGGLLANIAALNATIYSSSRVLFAMARDKFVWSRLGETHQANRTPYRAIILSAAIIILVALFFPIRDIAGAADLLFIALFMQLNIAYIQLRRKKPEAKWHYVVPFGVALPLLAVALYVVLGISLFHVSPAGLYFTAFWFLLGLVNYFAYTKTQEREELEREIVYEHRARFLEKLGYRVILPVASEEHWHEFSQVAFAMARDQAGELLCMRIHEVPHSLPLSTGFHTDHERRVLDKIESAASEHRLNIDTRLIAARSIPEAILETVEVENGDLLIMGWDGYVNTKGFIFGRNVDIVLHRVKCDLVVVKLKDILAMKKILIPVAIDENPNLRFTGKVATALAKWFGGDITILMVIPEKTGNIEYARCYATLEDHIRELKFKTEKEPHIKIVRSNHIASAILHEAAHFDVVLLPASRGRISKAIGVGSIPEQIAKHCHKTVIMAKGYSGIVQPLFDYIRSRF